MKGLDLARAFYEEYGIPLLKEFPDLAENIAIGLCGSGSECFGFDDDFSKDHDFEPGFCIFLPSEELVDRRQAFLLERAYAKLPKEFMGYTRCEQSPVGGNRHGVLRMADFFISKTGTPDGNLTLDGWFATPEYALAEATNGAIFEDGRGEFTAIRQRIAYLPQAVRRKKLAGHLLLMGQAGQYNYNRCMNRGETAAARLAAFEFAKSAIHAIFLLNETYLPFYKWQFRAMRDLPHLAELAQPLEQLLSKADGENAQIIEEIAAAISEELRRQGLSSIVGKELEQQAYAVNDSIAEGEIRNLHILYGI
jgi:hypothetical protein